MGFISEIRDELRQARDLEEDLRQVDGLRYRKGELPETAWKRANMEFGRFLAWFGIIVFMVLPATLAAGLIVFFAVRLP